MLGPAQDRVEGSTVCGACKVTGLETRLVQHRGEMPLRKNPSSGIKEPTLTYMSGGWDI